MLPTCLILFGAPGSGKGTQAKLLRKRCLDGPHISTGDILREHVETGDRVGREAGAAMAAGLLAPDGLVSRLVEERIGRGDCANGFILDGYPRTVVQARLLSGMLDDRGFDRVVIHLKVDYNKIIARLSGRRLCPQCGALYSVAPNASTISEVCDYDGRRLVIRDDDREEVVRERLETYETQTLPLLTYFREAPGFRFLEVDGTAGAPQTIAKEICGLLEHPTPDRAGARIEGSPGTVEG
ncbi:MAG: nucleoside monophosphate kinase [Bryobacteraceae bacterium]